MDQTVSATSALDGVVNGRRAAFAGGVGTMIEGYDFSMYGYMAVIVAPLFFPSDNEVSSLLLTLSVFAAAYAARPLGGIVFGYVGDRVSRRAALMTTLLCMGLSSAAIGTLPTALAIGPAASVALVCLRLLQGFSVGGEVAGAATLVSEAAPEGRRGRYGAMNPFGATLGFALASAVAGLVSFLTTDEQMASCGWRIPFLVALPLAGICLALRRSLVHQPAGENVRPASSPVAAVLKRWRKPLLQSSGVSLAVNGSAYFGLTYLSIHLITELGYPKTGVYWITTVVVAISAFLMLLTGRLGDRIGLSGLALIGLAGFFAVTAGAMALMGMGSLLVAGIAFMAIMVNSSFLQVAGYSMIPELFGPEVRYTGTALGWNIGVVVAGGTAPVVCVWLVERTGNALSPALFVMGVCAVGALAVLSVRRSQRVPA
ncbi:MFS transporter [Rhodococcus sp. NCIMB 12038]|uniref:MFS transporter n=1 Tax=Rhodococcus sp. NCIMB 12038 TaxID=933800 RepID=UPI000B3CEEE1|nr:MFS transporter [Rhodococcus sp. NCIMB 12038]OUS91327.1 MFS transporter [Rhodococcus sp. NCIMB 12038]